MATMARMLVGFAGALLLVGVSHARAHFLFAHIAPPAEAGRVIEVYFSEQAEAGDPRFIEKVAQTRLWAQTKPGEFVPLQVRKAPDRLRAHLPTPGTVAVVGSCEYGVLERPNQTPFLLHYYPKAIAGHADQLNRLRPCNRVPFEIVCTATESELTITVLHNSKPVPNALLTTVDAKLSNEELRADAAGQARWRHPAPGRYSVYTKHVLNDSGEFQGQKYAEIRQFATLAFTWPLARTGPDPEAVALFEEALATRATWVSFPGFSARVSGNLDGRRFDGSATVSADGAVQLEIDDDVYESWLQDQLQSIAMHRGAGAARESAPSSKPVLQFGDDDTQHPLGRLLLFQGGQFASSYRVRDKQIVVVNRNLGRQNMTITVLDTTPNADGRFLPHHYVVQYWDATTGDLKRTETVQDRWQRVGNWDLPAVHTVTTASEAGLSVRTVRLSGHQLTGSK